MRSVSDSQIVALKRSTHFSISLNNIRTSHTQHISEDEEEKKRAKSIIKIILCHFLLYIYYVENARHVDAKYKEKKAV